MILQKNEFTLNLEFIAYWADKVIVEGSMTKKYL